MVGYITLPAAPPPGPVLLSWQQPLRPEEASQMRASGDATAQALLATQMPIWQTTRRVLVEPLSAAPTAAIVQGGNKPHVTAAVPDWRVQPMATPADTLALAEKSPAPPARKRPPREKLKPQVVFLNRATIAQLDTLPGVGPKIALRILAYRKTLGGHFSSIQQLLDVPGIGPKTLDKMQPFLRL
jgi:competence ComEA-like helix-hairpin-helix protein